METLRLTLDTAAALIALSGLANSAVGSGVMEANGGNISHTGTGFGTNAFPGRHDGESGSASGSGAGGPSDSDQGGYGSGTSGAGTGGYTDGSKGTGSDKVMGSYFCQRISGAKGWKGTHKNQQAVSLPVTAFGSQVDDLVLLSAL